MFISANENTHLQAHIINGHVLLVTKKELRLEKELLKFREEPHDLDFTTCKHKGKATQIGVKGQKKKQRVAGKVQKYKYVHKFNAGNSPVTLDRIDLTYKTQISLVNVHFVFFLCPVIIRQMRSY